jgi:4,5-DOPA dioxygenase extradiol
LIHASPTADIPVLQLRIDSSKPPAFHYQLGQKLGALRDENVVIMGSGDTVHNLRIMDWKKADAAFDWAQRFDAKFLECLRSGNHAPLINYINLDPEALLAVPTPDHYLPLLYVLGAHRPDDELLIFNEGIDHGSISMLAFAFV